MDADTYPHEAVVDFFNRSDVVIPLRIRHDLEPYAERFQVRWTPCLLILDPGQRAQQREIGYQSPDELIPWALLGAGKAEFSSGGWDATEKILQRVVVDHPASFSAPEAVYLHAVARYKQDHDPANLKTAHLKLVNDYGDSIWVERTRPYSKL